MKILIQFEISPEAANFGGAPENKESLHEALCRLIHEGDIEAEAWLLDHVLDIAMPQTEEEQKNEAIEKMSQDPTNPDE